MELYPKRKTDAEHVEWVRQQVARSRLHLWFQLGMSVFFVVAFLVYWRWIYSIPETVPEMREGIGIGFTVGLSLGSMAAMMIFCSVMCIFFAIPHMNGFRTERLMLKYHADVVSTGMTASNNSSEDIGEDAESSS